MKIIWAAAIVICMSSNAMALELPKGSMADGRIKYIDYNEHDVVEIAASQGIATQVVFAEGEKILDIASGFLQGWEFNHRRNYLYLKPKSIKVSEGVLSPVAGKWDTNLVVTTNRRLYSFQLVLHAIHANKQFGFDPQVAYRIEFRYPIDEALKAKQDIAKKNLKEHLERKPAPRNWQYSMQIGQRSESIAPAVAYDDGRFTYLQFPNNREIPAVFVVADDKSESIVNTHVDPKAPDVLVIQRVAPEFVLRLGDEVVGVYNEAYDADGLPAKTGTTIPGLKRSLREGSKESVSSPEERSSIGVEAVNKAPMSAEEKKKVEIRKSIEETMRHYMPGKPGDTNGR